MRVVIDTNVFVSSFFGGYPRKVIDLWKTGQISLCLSSDVIAEYVEVLHRLGLKNEKELDEILALLASGFHSLFALTTPELRIVESDPDDNKFIECAVALDAEFVITGDRAVLAVGRYLNIKMVTPRQFFENYTAR